MPPPIECTIYLVIIKRINIGHTKIRPVLRKPVISEDLGYKRTRREQQKEPLRCKYINYALL